MAKKLQIVAKTDSFRRAGIEFGAEAKLIDPDKLSKEQVEALKSEPRLVVTEVEVKEDKKETADADGKGGNGKK